MELSKLLPGLIYQRIFILGAHSSFAAKTKNNHYLSGGSEGLTYDGKLISKAIELENDIINDGSVVNGSDLVTDGGLTAGRFPNIKK